jgi:diadenosine tetraphosphate (Ap4A) HIT family hydrolase
VTGWSEEWLRWRSGDECPYCADGRPDQLPFGARFFKGAYTDAYLMHGANAFGSALIIWRASHVVDNTDLSDEDAARYWRDVQAVSKVLQERYRPLKLNIFTHGNHVPHLHSVVVLRSLDDGAGNDNLLWQASPEPIGGRVVEEARALSAAMGRVSSG